MFDYEYEERIAIKMDSDIPEREAIKQTQREMMEDEDLHE